MSEAIARFVMGHIFQALEYVHSCGIVHRDLKVRFEFSDVAALRKNGRGTGVIGILEAVEISANH